MAPRLSASPVRVAARLLPCLLLTGSAVVVAPTSTVDHQSASGVPPTPARTFDTARLSDAYGRLPLSFEVNEGQADATVDFIAHGPGYVLLLTSGEAVLNLRQRPAPSAGAEPATGETPSVVSVQLHGAADKPTVAGLEELPDTANYFLGNDPSQWHTGIPTYAQVQYQAVYPGIDMVYHANQGQLEDDFVVGPGVDPSVIRLAVAGAEQVQLDDAGELVVHVPGGQLRQAAPVIYQDGPQGRQVVAGSYVLNDLGEIGFGVSAYDATRPLIIDPVLVYSTFLGGNGDDNGLAIAVDAGGNAYVSGFTESTAGFPGTPGAFQRTFGGGFADAFLTKLNPTGTAVVYSTFLGGNGGDAGAGIAVDAAGNAFVTGLAESTNFPTTPDAFQRTFGGGQADAFVAKLNPTGTTLTYSTYLGGNSVDTSNGIAVDAAGNAFVTGETQSSNFPVTPGAFQPTLGGRNGAFVTKLNAAGTALAYSTYRDQL